MPLVYGCLYAPLSCLVLLRCVTGAGWIFGFGVLTVSVSMASSVVLFVAAMLMAVMMVAVTVTVVLARRNSRHQIPSCLFREAHREAPLCSTQGCKRSAKSKHWQCPDRLLLMLFSLLSLSICLISKTNIYMHVLFNAY